MAVDLSLCYASVAQLRSALRGGAVSAVEVTRNALERIDATQDRINAFAVVDAEGALRAARQADAALAAARRGGPPAPDLCGIPATVKDLIEVAGLPCTYGSRTMAGHVPTADAPSVARLRGAGAVILGMTTTAEYGWRGYTENLLQGVTRNPWDLTRTTGGSSGGAVAAVAAGIAPLALGTDGGGSIRNPSALTGTVGIKAQFGRVPVYPASATPTLAHVGPIARSVADAAALLAVIAGPDPRDWTSWLPAVDWNAPAVDLAHLRVACSFTMGYGKVDAKVRAVVDDALRALEPLCGSIAVEEDLLADESELFLAEFIGGCSARLGKVVDTQPELIDPGLLRSVQALRARSVAGYTELLARRALVRDRLRQHFERFDVLLTPMMPSVAFPIGTRAPAGYEDYRMWTFFGYPFNLSGQPAGTLPCGFTAEGLPVGLQIVVPAQRDAWLVALMQRFEEALAVPVRRPTL